jgi:hypothetical protein
MCNGSEWREKFSLYGGMAEEDWVEYILPWNQTVSPSDVDPHAKRQPPGCSKTSFYLGVFFIENMLYLAAALLFGWYRLWLIKRKERKFASDPTQRGISRLLWWHRSQVKTQDAVKPSFWTRSFLGGFLPLMVGTLLAAAQVGLNMASAYIIQQTPGYSHVDIAHLGLLFCSRPRLTWVVCVLALWRKKIPRHFFKLKFSRTAAKATLASVAVSSTISEGLLQIVGVYYMGIAANSGREKGFYTPHHLRPYYRGVNAWTMYVGALMWLIACVPIIIIWPVLSMYHARIFFLLHRTRMRFWRLLRLPGYREEPYDPAANISANDFNEENTFLFLPNRNDWNLLNRDPAAFPALTDENGFNEPDLDDYNGFNEGIGPVDANDPTQMQETGALLSPHNMRGGEASSIHPSMMQESGDNDYGISSHASPSTSGVVLRRGLGSSGLRGGDGGDEEHEMYSIGLRGGAGDENDGGRYYSDNYAYSPPRNRTLPSRGPRYTQVRQTSGQGIERQTSLRGGAAAAAWKNKHLLEPTTKFDWYHLQAPIIWLGVVIGLISYAAQWMFWDGFVKASGERFCHPKLLGTAVTWAVGSILSKHSCFSSLFNFC